MSESKSPMTFAEASGLCLELLQVIANLALTSRAIACLSDIPQWLQEPDRATAIARHYEIAIEQVNDALDGLNEIKDELLERANETATAMYRDGKDWSP